MWYNPTFLLTAAKYPATKRKNGTFLQNNMVRVSENYHRGFHGEQIASGKELWRDPNSDRAQDQAKIIIIRTVHSVMLIKAGSGSSVSRKER